MKKYPIVFAISALMLAACNGDEEQTVEDEQAEATEVEAEEVTDEDEEEPEVVEEEADEDDGLLTEVGATVSEDGYELELLAYHDEQLT
ncbi:hypothetical protein JCM19037_1635 [Geomicrobium sp. JCM 19037]|uniref:hypothetical protein n=1 Tax=Geomicrobium sp. JCM 19037 TaxID=1460634 RepID=UPI00045F283E|nr:hypothetical protein [Geomicrobium sp. JCM 19037]GAK03319.1 hypothetical protein JCM19037_1635 [Geomicrobium sp. JCM 19037]